MCPDDPSPPSDPGLEAATIKTIKQVAGILDRRQRSFALAAKLKKLPPETIVEMFRLIAIGARFKHDLYQDAFRTVSDVRLLGKYLGNDLMSEIYNVARRKGYAEVVVFMQAVPPARQLGEDEELDEDPVLKEMTLGSKRSKARLRDRDLIDRLCHDQDPIVIENLLRNPAVTIRHVVRIASKRPTSAAILRVVYKDLRWINHYVVKKTLINNPYTPTQISVSLLNFLLEQDLEDVADNMLLHPLVKKTAIELIRLKRAGEGAGKPAEAAESEDG
jgi:hypothetical protein